MIIGDNYTREQIYNDVYRYVCEDGYHFESNGFRYGTAIYGQNKLNLTYIIKKDDDTDA